MVLKKIGTSKSFILPLLCLVLLAAVACGTAAPEAQKEAPKEPVVQKGAPTAAPTAVPEAMAAPPDGMKPEGTINVGLKEMGPFLVQPTVMQNPQIFVSSTAPIVEALLFQDVNRKMQPMLAESWSISDDFLTWTFKLRRGVQFHKGYGEMTSEDVVWSMQGFKLSKHPRAGLLGDFWEDRAGSETPDPYTVLVNSGEAVVADVIQRYMTVPGGGASFIASKRQTDELGVEAASQDIAGTGPWEIVEHRTSEFWRMEAVEDHWRQTPAFAELVYWEIPEESSRIAGFQTGKLDTFLMSFDTIPLVEAVEGARIMSIPNAIDFRMRIYGNWFPIPGVEPRPGYDPELPWVSASADFNSPEWDQARKVRLALITAIDRQALIDTILSGHGNADNPVANYTGFVELLEGRQWEFNPDRARELLAEAGAEGFSLTLTPALRGAPAEVEACEVVAQMFGDVGIDVKFQRIPYGTLRPQIVARTYQGVTCHAGSPIPTPAAGFGSYLSANPFNRGVEHPWLEEKMLEAEEEVDPVKLKQLEAEIGQFIFDNVLTDVVIYTMDAVWPVGPRLETWDAHVKTTDVRQMNGYEFIQHRKK